jgi:hypothetical protein
MHKHNNGHQRIDGHCFYPVRDIEKPGIIVSAHPIPAIYQVITSFEQKKTEILQEVRIVL